MKTLFNKLFILLMVAIVLPLSAQKKYNYEQVPGDPLNARIYTLDNGLKVYLAEYKEEPRIQTYVAMKVGAKHDPAETTGLAHYFEHMMFKGTPSFGTLNWEAEKVLLKEIEDLYEKYRLLTDPQERLEMYKTIDSVSYEASKFAIPNEYDRLMKSIGSRGTNAFTGYDFTAYIENIPSNQVENWAMIQAERFTSPVLRLFHTELETVYEEKNMSLTNDGRRASEGLMQSLYPNHPYGNQTVLGDAEHLKNPSLVNIRNFFDEYYVANNMAVVMAGDFNSDEVIVTIDKYFGQLKPGKVPELKFKPEPPITQPIEKEIIGLESENVRVAWRFPGAGTEEALIGDMMSMMLFNGKAGLIDLNVNQKQQTLRSYAFFSSMNDYSYFSVLANNKAGQTLEEAKDILLEQVELLKKGDFPEWMLESAINNLKLREMKRFESNNGIARTMAFNFMNGKEWKDEVTYLNQLSHLTKEKVVKFANEHLKDNNYVVIYKRQGTPTDLPKVDKPPITPIHINREISSDFFKMVGEKKVKEIQPVFLDYSTEINKVKTKDGLDIIYMENNENATFNLVYYFPLGSDHDKMINTAASYLEYLGTSRYTPEQINQEFYKLACSFSVSASSDQTYISLSGLSDNQEAAIILLEELIGDCLPNEEALKNMVKDILKSRDDAKSNQRANFSALVDFATYGENSPTRNFLSEEELNALTGAELIKIIRTLHAYPHEVLYYGPSSGQEIKQIVENHHNLARVKLTIPDQTKFEVLNTRENRVLFAHYDAAQSYLQTVSKGMDYDEQILPLVSMYNAYFGGGMNAIVFQEMREKRGLAYSAWARYIIPSELTKPFVNTSFIATQNDKVIDAFDAFNELFNEMPVSERAFELARESMITDFATNRVTKMSVIWRYLSDRKMGRDYDFRKKLYESLPGMTMNHVIDFNNKYISNQPKTYVILGHEDHVDFETIEKKYGPVTKMSKEEYFGF